MKACAALVLLLAIGLLLVLRCDRLADALAGPYLRLDPPAPLPPVTGWGE